MNNTGKTLSLIKKPPPQRLFNAELHASFAEVHVSVKDSNNLKKSIQDECWLYTTVQKFRVSKLFFKEIHTFI